MPTSIENPSSPKETTKIGSTNSSCAGNLAVKSANSNPIPAYASTPNSTVMSTELIPLKSILTDSHNSKTPPKNSQHRATASASLTCCYRNSSSDPPRFYTALSRHLWSRNHTQDFDHVTFETWYSSKLQEGAAPKHCKTKLPCPPQSTHITGTSFALTYQQKLF